MGPCVGPCVDAAVLFCSLSVLYSVIVVFLNNVLFIASDSRAQCLGFVHSRGERLFLVLSGLPGYGPLVAMPLVTMLFLVLTGLPAINRLLHSLIKCPRALCCDAHFHASFAPFSQTFLVRMEVKRSGDEHLRESRSTVSWLLCIR